MALPHESKSHGETPIAIIGMTCRFSGDVTSASKLWELCSTGKDGWSPIPTERFETASAKGLPAGGFFLTKEDISLFDAAFFNFPAEVAGAMDPQIRLMLESVYEATEDAGIPIEKFAGSKTSMFAGVYAKDFSDLQMRDPEMLPTSFLTGNGTAMLSNRVSHFYDLRGPSITVDTGCSSGLTAVHQACQSLYSGEAEVAIAGAATTMLSRDMLVAMTHQGVLGPEGKCFAWDERAHGYGRGEGVATLILKPLNAALRDGNNVHAVLRQIGLNQDGKTTTITSPSMDAQRQLIEDCYRRAGLDLSQTAYVEAHMTGTAVGDPIEAEAIARTFGASREKGDAVMVGSVKTNIGHTEPVSGIAAIIKTAMALKHAQIPPNLNYKTNNSNIPVEAWNVRVPTELTAWPKNKALRASVNNFGYGGANAHVIMEAAPSSSEQSQQPPAVVINGENADEQQQVFVLSAKDSTSWQSSLENLAAYLRSISETPATDDNSNIKAKTTSMTPHNLAYTLSERRSRFPWITAIRAKSLPDLAERLEQEVAKSKQAAPSKAATGRPRIGFVFNGQGAQWHAMGRELLSAYPVFRESIEKADQILKDHYGAEWSLIEELGRDAETTRVHEITISQPINVALQLALVDLLRDWAINPSAVTSHSSGEIAAAYAAGLLSFEQALGVVYHRGALADKYQKKLDLAGGMVAAGLGHDEAQEYLVPGVVVACVNSSDSVTLSGDLAGLEQVSAKLQEKGIFARALKVPLAYHSHHMQHMAEEYTQILGEILATGTPTAENDVSATKPIFASPVTGQVLEDPLVALSAPEHWVRNLVSPVLFSSAFDSMCFSATSTGTTARNIDVILEIGAHSTLSGPIRSILQARSSKLPYISCLKRNVDAVATIQDAACDLLKQNYPVSLSGVNLYSSVAKYPFLADLPSYAWNHTKSYWIEPRASREHRFSKTAPHELIGTRVAGDNGHSLLWRNILRVSDIEWLSDHRVETRVVLPGAAYVAMAVEAVRSLVLGSGNNAAASEEQLVRGYKLREVDIMNALTIPESSAGVEVMLSLKPCSDKELDHKGWYDFEISSLPAGASSEAWTMHCKGGVAVEMTSSIQPVATTRTEAAPDETTFFESGTTTRIIDIPAFFKRLRDMGFYHGPPFQNFDDSRAAGRKAITNLRVSKAAAQAASESSDYVLHPATLDSIIQAAYIDLADQQQSQDSMVLPRGIRKMFIPRGLSRRPGEPLRAMTELVKTDKRGSSTNIAVVNVRNNSEDKASEAETDFLQVHDFYVQAVAKDLSDDTNKGPRVCFKNMWEMDIFAGLPASVRNAMPVSISAVDDDYMAKCVRAAYYFITDAVAALEKDDTTSRDNWAWHHKIYFDWMKDVIAQGSRGELGAGSRAWSKATRGTRQMLIDELAKGSPAKRLLCRVGAALPDIIRGEITPLELMMADNLLNEYYMDVPEFQRLYKHLDRIVDLYAINKPGAKVLEIGAGTGGATSVVLQGFAARGGGSSSLLGHYTFTDISSGFFEAARQRFAGWTSLMDFRKLDIETDPAEQGFEAGTYDIIVASAVLHATKSLEKTMGHVRSLLKPGGKLIMLEQTKDRLEAQVVFGTTPGWWLGEESYRKSSPIATLDVWDRVLRNQGFSGVDFDVPDLVEDKLQSASVIISTNVAAVASPKFPDGVAVVYAGTRPQESWLSELVGEVSAATGIRPEIQSLEEAQVDNKLCIFTGEMDKPFLHTMDKFGFENLQRLLVSCRGVLWISCSGHHNDGSQPPLFAQADGLLRTLRHEDAGKRCVHIDFEARKTATPWNMSQIRHILHVLKSNFDETIDVSEVEGEYKVLDNDIIHVSRVFPDDKADKETSGNGVAGPAEMQLFDQPGRVLDWQSGQTGVLSETYFTDDFTYDSEALHEGMIEVEPKAFGLNFRDVMVALGQVEEDGLVYSEMCGVVSRLGPGTADSGLRIGDRVCGAGWGHITNRVRTGWQDVARLPEGLSFQEAASVPTIYITVYHSLVNVARLRRGETILIHAGTGGVGQAAIMLAQHIGATVYVTCSSAEKRDFLVQRYNVNPEHIFSSRDTSFAPALMSATQGKGVNVVLNCLAGPLLKAGWECIARFGRFIEIGKVDMQNARHLDMTAFRRCATISGVDILSLAAYDKETYRSALQASLALIAERAVKTVYPLHVYGVSELEKPLRQLQGGKHIGKFVIVPQPGELVKVVTRPKPVKLDANSTYMIVGGTTGIGRASAEWMMQKGAKNLLLVSRNARSHPEADSVVQVGKTEGCHVEIRNCDVADENSLLGLLSDIKTALPPIKGVLTTAMVLDDTVIERMTYEQWRHATLPKVASTMNLHNHLPDLSFFIMMSSTAGIFGNPSQANYNAGNAFQDALARYRTSKGLPATVIDLGIVESVGFVAQASAEKKQIIESSLRRGGIGAPLAIDHLLRLVERSVREPLRETPHDSQIVTCLAGWDETDDDSALHRDRRLRTLRLGTSLFNNKNASDGEQNGGGKDNSSFALTQKLSDPEVGATAGAAQAAIADALVGKMADVFSIGAGEIDRAMPMSHYGVDSLVAVELRNWLATAAKAKVTVFEILQTPSLLEFAALAAARSELLSLNVQGTI